MRRADRDEHGTVAEVLVLFVSALLAVGGLLLVLTGNTPAPAELPHTTAVVSAGKLEHSTPEQLITDAMLDYRHDRIQAAIAELKAALKKDKNNSEGWYDLGVVAQFLGNTSNAEADYLNAIQADANYFPAVYNEGLLQNSGPNTELAILYLGRAVRLQPKNREALLAYGLALENGNAQQQKQSIGIMQRARLLDPRLVRPPAQAQGLSG